jgi:pyocin large subunit-like protein
MMPSQQSRRSRQPAKHRLRHYASEPLSHAPPQEWPKHYLAEDLRQTVQQRQCGRSQQEQWWRHGHQKKVLHHVHSEQFFVELAKRGRTDGDPHEKNPQTNADARQGGIPSGKARRR